MTKFHFGNLRRLSEPEGRGLAPSRTNSKARSGNARCPNWKAVASRRTPKRRSGSGYTFSSYSDLGAWSSPGSGGGDQEDSGENNTSYSFQTYATYNGIDWSETGLKTSSGSGGTSDTVDFSPCTYPAGDPLTETNNTSYGYSEQAFLDNNAAWQNVGGSSGSFGASGTETMPHFDGSVYSGSDTASYQNQQNFTLSANGGWTAASGSTSSSGSVFSWYISPPTVLVTGRQVASIVGLAPWPGLVGTVWG